MKKATFLFAGLALIAASCSETEIVNSTTQETPETINFSAYANRLTKAVQTDVTTANLNSFNVTAIGDNAVYFDNITFTKGSSGVWESSTEYAWPNYALDFYAYNIPVDNDEQDKTGFSQFINNEENKNLKVTPAKEIAHQEDFVVAEALDQTLASTSGNDHHAVNLTFKHYLTQFVIEAMNSRPNNYTVEVSGVKITNIAGTGVYTFSNNQMTASTTENVKTSYEVSFSNKELTSVTHKVMGENGYGQWYLVPQTVTPWVQSSDIKNTANGAYLALKVRISASNGDMVYPKTTGEDGKQAYAWMAMPMPSVVSDAMEYAYAQGKKYTIIFNFFSDGKGAGFVDPQDPGDLDGDGSTEEDKGQPIGGHVIKFNATVDEWDADNTTITINL